jgi:hypothetical protein
MTNRNFLAITAIALTSLLIVSCKKDNGDPSIKFLPGPGFTGKDTMMMVGDTIKVTIEVEWNSVDVLEMLDIRQNDVSLQTVSVTVEKASYNIKLVKGSDETEKWTFIVSDIQGNKAQVELKLTKDPNSIFGSVNYYTTIVMGAQKNTANSGFVSLQTNQLFNLDLAFTNQPLIDLLYYSDPTTQSTLASPGSEIPDSLYTGYKNIPSWSIRNISRFLQSAMSAQEFSTMPTDAVIINGWKEDQSVTEAINLKVNDIWLVKLKSGKKGAIFVKRIVAGDTGEIEFDLKIQK